MTSDAWGILPEDGERRSWRRKDAVRPVPATDYGQLTMDGARSAPTDN